MSDVDDDTRSTATNTFASLVKMVPLEAGLPDPPDFPPELLQRRENERQFLTQLLDGSKVEQYEIPIKINAELHKYQQGGVNWLAFLAKYQLHGILCDGESNPPRSLNCNLTRSVRYGTWKDSEINLHSS